MFLSPEFCIGDQPLEKGLSEKVWILFSDLIRPKTSLLLTGKTLFVTYEAATKEQSHNPARRLQQKMKETGFTEERIDLFRKTNKTKQIESTHNKTYVVGEIGGECVDEPEEREAGPFIQGCAMGPGDPGQAGHITSRTIQAH